MLHRPAWFCAVEVPVPYLRGGFVLRTCGWRGAGRGEVAVSWLRACLTVHDEPPTVR